MFKQNESKTDRLVRVIVGIVSILLSFMTAGLFHTVLLVVGVLGIFTGLTGFCLLYKIFDITTKK